MEDEFLTTAASFWRMPENADRRDVFFAVVNFPRASAVFQKVRRRQPTAGPEPPRSTPLVTPRAQHGFKSVPMLVHFPPSSEDARAGKQRWHIRPSQLYEVTDSALSAEGIARFVKRHSAAGDISIYRSPWPKIAGAALTLAALAGAVRLALANLPLVLAAVRSKRLWVVVCIVRPRRRRRVRPLLTPTRRSPQGIYFLSISGFVFDIIRNPPPFVCQQGRCMFIHPQSGTQFVAEGFIIGGLTLACAAAAVRLVHTYAAGHKAAERQVTTTLLALVAFAVLYSQVLAIYRGKNPWYPFRLLF